MEVSGAMRTIWAMAARALRFCYSKLAGGMAAGTPARSGRLKCQVLVIPFPRESFTPEPGSDYRMVVRTSHPDTHRGEIFSALVTSGNDPAPDSRHLLLTMTVLGSDADGYLDTGQRFTLWRGHDVARGVVTRRLFT